MSYRLVWKEDDTGNVMDDELSVENLENDV